MSEAAVAESLQPGDLRIYSVDARQHDLQQRRVLGVKNFAPSGASVSGAIFGRALRRASCTSAFGSRSPAMRWSMTSQPVTPCRPVGTEEILTAASISSGVKAMAKTPTVSGPEATRPATAPESSCATA